VSHSDLSSKINYCICYVDVSLYVHNDYDYATSAVDLCVHSSTGSYGTCYPDDIDDLSVDAGGENTYHKYYHSPCHAIGPSSSSYNATLHSCCT
jgi:hypothetical protein